MTAFSTHKCSLTSLPLGQSPVYPSKLESLFNSTELACTEDDTYTTTLHLRHTLRTISTHLKSEL